MNHPPKKIKFGFSLDRSASVKTYAPIIIEALKRNLEVILLCGPHPFTSFPKNKIYRPIKENLSFPNSDQVRIVYFENKKDLPGAILANQITDIISIPFISETYDKYIEAIKSANIKIHMIQWYADFLVTPPDLIEKYIDTVFTYSQSDIRAYKASYPKINETILKKFIPIGFLPSESLNHIADKNALRQKYNLPKGKKVVTLMTLPIAAGDPFWYKHVFAEPNRFISFLKCIFYRRWSYLLESLFGVKYNQIIKCVKKWTIKNKAILIVKNKAKYQVPTIASKVADIEIKDSNIWFPQKSFEVSKISDIVINFSSSGLYDIISSKAFNISITLPNLSPNPNQTNYFFTYDKLNHPGVSITKKYNKFCSFLLKTPVASLAVNPQEQLKYADIYLGQTQKKPSSKIVDYLEK